MKTKEKSVFPIDVQHSYIYLYTLVFSVLTHARWRGLKVYCKLEIDLQFTNVCGIKPQEVYLFIGFFFFIYIYGKATRR